MTHWAQLLHFYQPPTQSHEVLRKVTEESYRPLLKVLGEHENARLAVNIQGVLTELLLEHGFKDVIHSLKQLAERGIVEFVGSGKFHPILPLIPEPRRTRSIADHAVTNGAAFGRTWKPRGFFPPEMCFSQDIVASVATAGHEWLIMSGVGCPVEWPLDRIHRVSAGEKQLAVLFRDDVRSNRISFRETNPNDFLADLAGVGGDKDAYVVTAMDAETFGHHIVNWHRDFLGETFSLLKERKSRQQGRVRLVLPSELIQLFPAGDVIEPHASSWSTTTQDLAENNPFPLWKAPGNEFHQMQWEYVDHCLALEANARKAATTWEAEKFSIIASDLLEPALHSCQFWWASRRPMWDFTMIHRGFLLLNEVELNASHAIALGGGSEELRRESAWRAAAASDLRLRIERELVQATGP